MKTLNVRELRAEIPHLKETLAQEHEIVLVVGGEPVARILPMPPKRQLRSLAAHRAMMEPLPAGTLERLIREERDLR
jgi:antitoxin (DNA-binding transcriptional repressor) of toxin-antitoxin stability system